MASAESLSGNQKNVVANKANLLNYQTDSSDDSILIGGQGHASDSDSQGLEAGMARQKGQLESSRMQETWGQKKKDYYKDESGSGEDDSSDAEDIAKEAERLQKIRQHKLARQFAR